MHNVLIFFPVQGDLPHFSLWRVECNGHGPLRFLPTHFLWWVGCVYVFLSIFCAIGFMILMMFPNCETETYHVPLKRRVRRLSFFCNI